MNKIIQNILESRKGHYVHALEVEEVYELQNVIEQIYSDYIDLYQVEEIKDFFQSISLYCLNDENEGEVYNFNINLFIDSLN